VAETGWLQNSVALAVACGTEAHARAGSACKQRPELLDMIITLNDIDIDNRIVVDYVQVVIFRLCRRTFGSLPSVSYHPDHKHGWHAWYKHPIKRIGGYGTAHLFVDFPEVIVSYSYSNSKSPTFRCEFSVADPRSFKKINQFFKDIFKYIKKNRIISDEIRMSIRGPGQYAAERAATIGLKKPHKSKKKSHGK